MHALIIEDDMLVALMIQDQLRMLGFTTFDFASTEAEAVTAAKARPPDFITCDVGLEAGDGLTAVAEICNDRPVPIVYITGTAWQVRQSVRDAVIVEKPFAAAELERALAGGIPSAPTPKD
jgi:two-component system, response regulator PdtaR